MALTDALQVGTDDTQTGIFTGSTGVGLQRDTGKACDGSQFVTQVLNQLLVSFSLILGYLGVQVHEFGTAQGKHLRSCIELHGAGTE